jgi:hypothetical protein
VQVNSAETAQSCREYHTKSVVVHNREVNTARHNNSCSYTTHACYFLYQHYCSYNTCSPIIPTGNFSFRETQFQLLTCIWLCLLDHVIWWIHFFARCRQSGEQPIAIIRAMRPRQNSAKPIKCYSSSQARPGWWQPPRCFQRLASPLNSRRLALTSIV